MSTLRKSILQFVSGVGLLILGFTASSTAAIITTATGTNGADAYIQFGTATTNYGSLDALTIKYGGNDTGTTNRKGYLRFDLSSITDLVTDASLSLTLALNNGGSTNTTPQNFTFNVYGLNDGTTAGGGFLGEDWSESAITWSNAPANITSGAGAGNAVKTGAGTTNGGQTALLGSFSVNADPSGTTLLALSGTNLVNFLNADTDNRATLIITRTGWTSGGGSPAPSQGGANSAFATKEHLTLSAPTLNVTVIPEPSTLALAAIGLLGLVEIGRRRGR